MEQVVSQFLRLLKIPISKGYVERLISSHPSYPSLLSISDVLQRLGINHVVTRIEKEKAHELEFPYLIPLNKGQGDILIVRNEGDLRKHQTRLNEEWGGAVLLAESTIDLQDEQNNKFYFKEKSIKINCALIMFALACLLLMTGFYLTALENLLLVSAVVGVIVGYFLLSKELGVSYTTVEAFCNAGKNINCDKVLKSDVTLLGVSFSDAGLTYFLFQSIMIGLSSFLPSQQNILFILSILGFFALPVVIFSIYYQHVVVKTWCLLCLAAAVLLIMQAMIFGFGFYKGIIGISISLPVLVSMTLVALIVLLIVITVKAVIEHYEKLAPHGGNGNRVKHNATVFASLLIKQKKVDVQPFEHEMMLGRSTTPIKIIMVSNLFCSPCKLKHEVVHQLVSTFPDLVNVSFRFVRSGNEPASVVTLLNYWFQNIYREEDESSKTASMLHDWFELWDLKKFEKKFSVKMNGTAIEKLEAKHYAWTGQVTMTPTFFVNGYELPDGYIIDDLLAMVPSLAHSFEKSVESEVTLHHAESVPN